ncbi:MAG: hypothetical protein RR282_00725 [Acinetobacter sp.]
MRSDFERWLGDVWLSDAEWDESKNTYSDSRIHCMWSAWQHQQTKVDELQKEVSALVNVVNGCNNKLEQEKQEYDLLVNRFVDRGMKLRGLQRLVDAAIYLLPSIKAENDLWGCDQVEHQIELLEQTLKGGEG